MTFEDSTPSQRLAAVAKSVVAKFHPDLFAPDYADFELAFNIYVERELLKARIDEVRKVYGDAMTTRVRELAAKLSEIETKIPATARFRDGEEKSLRQR